MQRNIVSVGKKIDDITCYGYDSMGSLRDFDISVFWLGDFNKENFKHWAKEIKDFLNAGKNVYFIVNEIPKNLELLLPGIPSDIFIESRGTKVKILDNKFKISENILEGYVGYFDKLTTYKTKFLYTTQDGQTLGFCKEYYNGNIVFLPKVFSTIIGETKEEDDKLNKEFVSMIVKFDKILSPHEVEESIPERVEKNEKFQTNNVKNIERGIEESKLEMEKLQANIEKGRSEIREEKKLLTLIYGTGKSLENAVSKSLEILGYKVTNYNDGELEIDQVIETSEGKIFIGECKGKEGSVDITDFRQLYESKDRFYELENIKEIPGGILFGNTERLKHLEERGSESFTKKALDSAKASNIVLIRTSDLFFAVKYIIDNPGDENYKERCREAIETSQGKIVEFPEPTE